MRLSVEPSLHPADYDFAHSIRVRFVETDGMNVVHHSNYLAYFEEARVAYLRHLGHPFTEWREAGIESPVLESFVTYRRPLMFDDVLTVHLRLAAITRATFQIAYLMTVDDHAGSPASGSAAASSAGRTAPGSAVRASGVTVHGCVTTDGRPTRLPAWLTELGASRR